MNKKTKSILNGKGFYVSLALSVAMVGAACYFAYSRTGGDITGTMDISSAAGSDEREAAEIHTDIPRVTFSTQAESEESTKGETEAKTEPEEHEKEEEDTSAQEAQASKAKSYSMPLEGEVLNEFSGGELVKSKTTGAWQTHNGIDISAALGDSVLAAGAGTVSAVDNDPLWGYTVTIDHGNGVVTRYSNLNEGVLVSVGQEVSRGEEIGAVGETADIETSEKSHLHFEVIKNGSYTNPLEITE